MWTRCESALPQIHSVGEAGKRTFGVSHLVIAIAKELLCIPSDMNRINKRVSSSLATVDAGYPSMRRADSEISYVHSGRAVLSRG